MVKKLANANGPDSHAMPSFACSAIRSSSGSPLAAADAIQYCGRKKHNTTHTAAPHATCRRLVDAYVTYDDCVPTYVTHSDHMWPSTQWDSECPPGHAPVAYFLSSGVATAAKCCPVRHAAGGCPSGGTAHINATRALAVFAADLRNYPENAFSLRGTASALKTLGEEHSALAYEARASVAWQFADLALRSPCPQFDN